jgi:hypothetical protein
MTKEKIRPILERELADWLEKWLDDKYDGSDLSDAKIFFYSAKHCLAMAKAALLVLEQNQ